MPAVAAAVPVAPRVESIVSAMASTYANATSYTDRGEVVTVFSTSPDEVRRKFATVFVRPASLRLEFETGPGHLYTVWAQGGQVFAYWPPRGVEVQRSLDHALGAAFGGSSQVSGIVPSMLMSDLVRLNIVAHMSELRLDGEETIDGVTCWQVTGPGRNATFTLFIDKTSHLLRRVHTLIHFAASRTPTSDVDITVAYDPRLDPVVAPSELAGPNVTTSPPAVIGQSHRTHTSPAVVPPPISPLTSKSAPDFAVEILSGSTATRVHLAELRGHVVVLDFWATWCAPCVVTMPALDKLQTAHAAAGLRVIGVSTEDADDIRAFVKEHKLGYTIARDGDATVSQAYDVAALPMVVLIDKTGTVRDVLFGAGRDDQIETAVTKLLDE